MDQIRNKIVTELSSLPISISKSAETYIADILDKAGIYYRVFARTKSVPSTIKKMEIKNYGSTKKMQDLLGVRVVLYFKDDINLCEKMLKNELELVDESIDRVEEDKFSPTRLNLVFKIPEKLLYLFNNSIWELPIDQTFEVQIRTIFSEGWHEVEHDLRYKNKRDWVSVPDLSRSLNGIFATLDTCDWAILHVFDDLAYEKYKSEEWECMLRNHWRIRMNDTPLSASISSIFDKNKEVAKLFYRVKREVVIECISTRKTARIPKTMDNIIYIINHKLIHNESIDKITPLQLKNIIDD